MVKVDRRQGGTTPLRLEYSVKQILNDNLIVTFSMDENPDTSTSVADLTLLRIERKIKPNSRSLRGLAPARGGCRSRSRQSTVKDLRVSGYRIEMGSNLKRRGGTEGFNYGLRKRR